MRDVAGDLYEADMPSRFVLDLGMAEAQKRTPSLPMRQPSLSWRPASFAVAIRSRRAERLRRLPADPEFKKKQRAAMSLWRKRRPYGDFWKKGAPHPGF